MQDLKLLEKLGATPASFRAKFTAKKPSDKITRLQELHAARIREAIDLNIREAPIYGAIDRALEAAQKNVPNIIARELAESGKTHEEIIGMLKDFKLDRMLEPAIDQTTGEPIRNPKISTEPLLTFNQPVFDQVFVPLVLSYSDMRLAKLFNDRNTFPRYKYAPQHLTIEDALIGEMVTDRVQTMTQQMGYSDDDKQSLRQMIYYGTCFNFPKESYWREQYQTTEGGKTLTKTQREGVRFAIPHPRRHFWDRSVPLYSFNSDTGTNYAGYWDINRWEDVVGNKAFWNTDKVTQSGYDLLTNTPWKICQEFYPCTVALPGHIKATQTSGQHDRIDNQVASMLMKDEKDASVITAVIFHKLIPKDWDLFDYEHPIWMRFVYANIATCVYCEELPYTPGFVYLDRYDANKTVSSSLALQLTPSQQLIGNFITQHFQSVKQNLLRIAFVNTDIVPVEQVNLLKKWGDAIYRRIRFLTFSRKQDGMFDQDRRDAIIPVNVPQVNTQELQANISLVLSMLERMLGFSAQEVGSSSSHEQSAREVAIVQGSTSVNLEFMGNSADVAIAAKKRLLYTAFYCYGDDEILADVADLTPERKAALEKLGFSIEGKPEDGATRFTAKGKKAALVIDTFFTDREGLNRLNDSKLGIAMMQMVGQIAAGPLFQTLGAKQVVDLINYSFKMIGFPDDFSLRSTIDKNAQPEEQQKQIAQVMKQASEAIVKQAVEIVDKQLREQIMPGVAQEMTKLAGALQQLAQSDAKQTEVIKQIMAQIQQAMAQVQQVEVQVQQNEQAVQGLAQDIQNAAQLSAAPAPAFAG